MYKESIELLKKKGIEFEEGLTSYEVSQIEKTYDIIFPSVLKELLMIALPITDGFYDWRNKEQENVERIKDMINQPIKYIMEMPEEIYWCEDWGEEPVDEIRVKFEVMNRLKSAPKLIPIYANRYVPINCGENPPVISVHGVDVIYYGKDIQDYFEVEFGEKNQNAIDFESISGIPFWTDIM